MTHAKLTTILATANALLEARKTLAVLEADGDLSLVRNAHKFGPHEYADDGAMDLPVRLRERLTAWLRDEVSAHESALRTMGVDPTLSEEDERILGATAAVTTGNAS